MSRTVYPRTASVSLLADAVAITSAAFSADFTLPANTVYAFAMFSAAPGDLQIRHDSDVDRIEFRANAVDWSWPSIGGLTYPLAAAKVVAFRPTNAVNVTLYAFVRTGTP